MLLASTQTVTGLKTFLNGTFGLRNIANTITSFFSSAATVARTYTLRDADGTLAFTTDITGVNSGTNTGDNTVATAITGTPSVTLATVTTTGNIELGNASDTTISRVSAGVIAVEGATINGFTTTATSGGTTTLTIASGIVQSFTGSLTQTVLLPTTSVLI